ncbi:MAG: hypothetical protein ACI9UA_001948 [Pseudoalteromonas tetraodonis]|jgi:hypothetical protein
MATGPFGPGWQKNVLVEGIDGPIAVAPRIPDWMNAFFAGGVRVAKQVQPMPPPALAVVRRGQQLVDDLAKFPADRTVIKALKSGS